MGLSVILSNHQVWFFLAPVMRDGWGVIGGMRGGRGGRKHAFGKLHFVISAFSNILILLTQILIKRYLMINVKRCRRSSYSVIITFTIWAY